ncbi:Imm50 family immunity protein [Caballeronia sp. J97]|uniref:Imm50 family immunity protein n=1 Tax=Caballeronia sp. J97 TaxID=2805429 RepID=UPI002AAF7208|nr:Imm50 family immunity protein [Caballeronia sp. J97]
MNAKSFGWELAKNSFLFPKILGEYPSFHDSAVQSFFMQRVRSSHVNDEGEPLAPGCERDLVDLTLEILHNRYGPRHANDGADFLVTIKLLDIKAGNIDINAMLEEAWIRDITLTQATSGLIEFDLNPNIGLDVVLTCKEIIVESIRPYYR